MGVSVMNDKKRRIYVELSRINDKYGYEITVDGEHACSGTGCQESKVSYGRMLEQLKNNENCFHVDIENPFEDEE
jgi:hypothetical protein